MAAVVLSSSPCWAVIVVAALCCLSTVTAQTDDTNIADFINGYGPPKAISFLPENNTIVVRLDQYDNAIWKSSKRYFHGIFSIRIKIPAGYSSGLVTSFYLASQTSTGNDEVDFELLGHTDPRRMVIHTNYFTKGIGGHEEQMFAWFDGSEYHTYTIVWGFRGIVWLVDGIPIREFTQPLKNPYRNASINLPMVAEGSLWDGSSWATRDYNGTRLRADYSKGPFTASYTGFEFNGCVEKPVTKKPKCMRKKYPTGYAWDGELSEGRRRIMMRMRRKYLKYKVGWRRAGRHPPSFGDHPPGVGKHPPKNPPPRPPIHPPPAPSPK